MSTARVVAIAALAALVFGGVNARASTSPTIDDPLPEPDPFWPDWPGSEEDQPMPVEDIETKKLRAFIYMIECAETAPRDVETGRAFHVFYGNSTFQDLSNHPVLTGEKRGVPLSYAMCRNAGFGPGCVSTAAGAGQINLPTWRSVCGAGEWGCCVARFQPCLTRGSD